MDLTKLDVSLVCILVHTKAFISVCTRMSVCEGARAYVFVCFSFFSFHHVFQGVGLQVTKVMGAQMQSSEKLGLTPLGNPRFERRDEITSCG